MREQVDLRMQAHQKKRAFEAKVRALAANVCQGNGRAVNKPRSITPATISAPS